LPQRRYSEARELAFKSSPVSSFANWRSPVLFVHGDDDRNVPFQQTTDLVEKLLANGANGIRDIEGKVAREAMSECGQRASFKAFGFEELIFPDEIHDLLRWSDWIRAYRATAEFFDRKLAASGERQ